jgi:hypothetical protein
VFSLINLVSESNFGGRPGKTSSYFLRAGAKTDAELFNQHEDPTVESSSLEEIERRLFGISRPNYQQQEITDVDHIPIKTGTGVKLMKNGPKHILDAEDLEPLYIPQEHILEECLRREAERVAHQENLMNRVVYDSVDTAPKHLMGAGDIAGDNVDKTDDAACVKASAAANEDTQATSAVVDSNENGAT